MFAQLSTVGTAPIVNVVVKLPGSSDAIKRKFATSDSMEVRDARPHVGTLPVLLPYVLLVVGKMQDFRNGVAFSSPHTFTCLKRLRFAFQDKIQLVGHPVSACGMLVVFAVCCSACGSVGSAFAFLRYANCKLLPSRTLTSQIPQHFARYRRFFQTGAPMH